MTRKETLESFYRSFQYKDEVNLKEFRGVIDDFNLRASEAMAEGEVLKCGIGHLRVLRTERCLRASSVDWEASNKLKKEILARGGTPYNKLKNPHGEEWLIFHTQPFVYKTHWKRRCYIKNVFFYKFKTYKHHRKRVAKNVKDGTFELI